MIFNSISKVEKFTSNHAIANYDFFKICEQAQLTNPDTGWIPFYFQNENSFTYCYLKNHSYGEYIFDWSWANFYQQNNINYYPKIIHALPFTPCKSPKYFGDIKIFDYVRDFYQHNKEIQSHHLLFSDEELKNEFQKYDYFEMHSIQYHFINKYKNIDQFLNDLKSRKRKNIIKERNEVNAYQLRIEKKYLKEISNEEIKEIYQLYLSTIDKKNAYAYLNFSFYELLLKSPLNAFFHLAYNEENKIMAMALFFEDEKTLYGRYWGIDKTLESKYRFLHFEMCYYMAIDYTIKKKLEKFEAGAQGEQKLLRGFTPVLIKSLHHLKIPQMHSIIKKHTFEQNLITQDQIKNLDQFLPYKKGPE